MITRAEIIRKEQRKQCSNRLARLVGARRPWHCFRFVLTNASKGVARGEAALAGSFDSDEVSTTGSLGSDCYNVL